MGAKAQVARPIQNAQHTSIAGLLAICCLTREFDRIHGVDVQVGRDCAGAAVGAASYRAVVRRNVDSHALGFLTASGDGDFAAADLGLGVIEGLDNAVCGFFHAVAGNVDPNSCGVVRNNLVRDIGNIRIDLLLSTEILHAEDNHGNEGSQEDKDDGAVRPRARALSRRAITGLGTGGRTSGTSG